MNTTTIELTQAAYEQLVTLKPAKLSVEAFLAKLIAKEYASTGKPSTGSANFDKYGSAYVTNPELAIKLAQFNFEGAGNLPALLAEPGCLDAIKFVTARFSYENWQPLLQALPQSARLALEPAPSLSSFAAVQYACTKSPMPGFLAELDTNVLQTGSVEKLHSHIASKLARCINHGADGSRSQFEALISELAQFEPNTKELLAVLVAKRGV